MRFKVYLIERESQNYYWSTEGEETRTILAFALTKRAAKRLLLDLANDIGHDWKSHEAEVGRITENNSTESFSWEIQNRETGRWYFDTIYVKKIEVGLF